MRAQSAAVKTKRTIYAAEQSAEVILIIHLYTKKVKKILYFPTFFIFYFIFYFIFGWL